MIRPWDINIILTKEDTGLDHIYERFFNKLMFIQNTVPKEHDAAEHASKVWHEAPVLLFYKGKRKLLSSLTSPATASGCWDDLRSNSFWAFPLHDPISSKIPQYFHSKKKKKKQKKGNGCLYTNHTTFL